MSEDEQSRARVAADHVEESLGAQLDDAIPTRGYQMLPVVGLGASAGGIAALRAFFQAMPADAGMAYVIVMHLSPTHESSLAGLLQQCTTMPVTQVQGTERLEADHVYVIPPAKGLRTMDGHLRVFDLPPDRTRHVAVDHFFRTLADTHGPHASAVMLSGADSDGAIGIKRIKERGGLTIAQDPSEAEHEGMPRAAIATGMIDWVLPVAEMPQRLVEYTRQEHRLRLPPEEAPPPALASNGAGNVLDDEVQLRDVLTFLRTRTGRDFSSYKRATILRRIGRRMQVNGVDDLAAYLDCLRTRPGEAGALLQDLLISVTNFFRDPDCFGALESRIASLFANKGSADTVRVWVVACATGEEAYSVAMLLSEYARMLESPPVVQVFATDLDDDAIQVAREGVYPPTIVADVSEDRLRRFFVKEHRGYRVRREIREMVLFAVHDLLKDSPFSRLDLLTCRNLLIYLNREAKARALDIFHFALRPDALLFLGSSESVEEGSTLFDVLDKKHRLYRQRPAIRHGLPVSAGPTTLSRALELQQSAAGEGPSAAGRGFEQGLAPMRQPARQTEGRAMPWGDVHLRLLDRMGPPSVLVDADHEILHLSQSAGRFLQFAGGEPSHNLLHSVHPALRVALRAALYQAAQTGQPAQVPGIRLDIGDAPVSITLRAVPAQDIAPGLTLVSFELGSAGASSASGETGGAAAAAADPIARQLDREIERLKLHLRDTVEQYEASNEELKASNEELQAMNEELRSATEELETSREELQSINEELTTVNHELKSKVDELGHANSDMHNLMDATAIATVFLDRQLCITRYTPSAVSLFNFIATDIGRPLTDLTSRLRYATLAADAKSVLDTLLSMEREVGEQGGSWYLARLRPYRTIDDHIAGVVLAFVDITERKRAQEAQRRADIRFRAIVDQATVGVVQVDSQGRIAFANERMAQMLGYAAAQLPGRDVESLIHPEDLALHRQRLQRMVEHGETYEIEKRMLRSDGSEVWIHNSATFLSEAPDEEATLIAVCVDITKRKHAQAALRASEERLRMVIESAREYAIFSTDLERRITGWNSGAERILGYSEAEALGRLADMLFTPEDRLADVPQTEARLALADGRASDDRYHLRKDGSALWASGVLMPMLDDAGLEVGFVKVLRDQTEARRAREALERSQSDLTEALRENEAARAALESANIAKDQFLAVLSHELRTPLTPAAMAVQLLLRRKDLPPDMQDALALILRNIRIESNLIDDLLDLTHISRGTLEVARDRVDLHRVIRGAIEICESDLQGREQQLMVALDAAAPTVLGDSRRLQQVVWNLLKNASKFTPPGGRVGVRTASSADRVLIEVSDNGVGIDAEAMDHIFDAFAQEGPWVAREFGGLGLGLAISKATIDAHGGSLRVSSPGRGLGAVFTVELPGADQGEGA